MFQQKLILFMNLAKWLLTVIILFIASIPIYIYANYIRFTQTSFVNDPSLIDPKSVHIFMAFGPKFAKLMGDKNAAINRAYAMQYGFNFHVFDPDSSKYVFPHYKRYVALQQLLNQYPDNTYFFYIDGDAIVQHTDLDIRNWFQTLDSDTYVLFGNQDQLKTGYAANKQSFMRILVQQINFNSGIIIIKNNAWSREFINHVLDPKICNHAKDSKDYLVNFFRTKDQNCIGHMYSQNKFQEKDHIKVIPAKHSIQYFNRMQFSKNIPIFHPAGPKKYLNQETD